MDKAINMLKRFAQSKSSGIALTNFEIKDII